MSRSRKYNTGAKSRTRRPFPSRQQRSPIKLRAGADAKLKKIFSRIGKPAPSDFVPDPFQLEAVQAARPSGADVLVETVSQPEETPLYIQMLRREGHLVIAGYHPETNWVDLAPMQDKAITCYTTGGFTRARIEATLADLIAGKFHVAPLITHRVPWREATSAYERLVRDKVEDSLGIVIDWR